jgi:TonB family protein
MDIHKAQEPSVTKLTPHTQKIYIAVVASALLHGAVILSVFSNTDDIAFSSRPAGFATFQISLAENIPVAANKSLVKKTDSTSVTSEKIKSGNMPTAATQSASEDQQRNSEQQQQHRRSNISNDMMQYLETEFRARFQYPVVAVKRGWQGKVIVGLDINKAGFIHNVNVRQSSGYSVLDNNAIRTFENIGNIIPALSKGNTRNYQFSIPIIYQLTKG